MSAAERKLEVEQWTVLRYTVAAGWSHEQYSNGDTGRAKRILDAVEIDTRPFSKVGFVLRFKSHDADSTAFCIPLLNDAEKELRKSERPFSEKSLFWFQIMKQHSVFNQYVDAATAFESFVKDLNTEVTRAEKSQPKRPFALSGFGNTIPPKLLRDQYQTLVAASDSVGSSSIRIQIQVELMKTALSQLDKVKVDEIKTD